MARSYRKFDEDFKQGAVRLVVETGKPIAQVARELGVNEGTLGILVRPGPPGPLRRQPGVDGDRAGPAGAAAEGEHRAADAA